MNEDRNPIYTDWKTLKSIKSKTLKPGCRLVSIFWTINHFSDTRAVFTPTLDSPVMYSTVHCPVLYRCTMGNQVIYSYIALMGYQVTVHCTMEMHVMKCCLSHFHTTMHCGQPDNTLLFSSKRFLCPMECECKYGVKMAIK